MNYIILLTAVILLAVNFVFSKLYQNEEGTAFKTGMFFNILGGIATCALFFILNGFKVHLTITSFILAFIQSASISAYTLLGFKIMSKNNMGDYTFFLMTGGMLVPFVFGVLLLNENLEALHILGIIVLIASMFLINGGMKSDFKTKMLCLAIFFLNGSVSIISKVHQLPGLNTVSVYDFVFISNLIKSVLCALVMLFSKKEKFSFAVISPKGYLFTILAAVVSGISFMFQLYGASNVPATVLFPIITGGTIVLSNIASKVVFKEKLSKQSVIGTALCVVGTCLFL